MWTEILKVYWQINYYECGSDDVKTSSDAQIMFENLTDYVVYGVIYWGSNWIVNDGLGMREA